MAQHSGFWQRLFGRGDDADAIAAPEAAFAPPLFQPRPVPPPPPRGPGLPDWHEILSAAPPVPEPSPDDPPPTRLTLVPDVPAPEPQPQAAPADLAADAAKRPPTEEERAVLAQVGALLGSAQIAQAAALLDRALADRPEICDSRGRPIYLLESLHCALRLGDAATAADRAGRLRPHLAADDPVIELLSARVAMAVNDRIGTRAAWLGALARQPELTEAKAWLAAHPISPDGGVQALDLLGPMAAEWAGRIQPPPSLSAPPAEGAAVPDWSAARLLLDIALSVGEDGLVRAAHAADAPQARAAIGGVQDLAMVFRHPEGIGRPHAFAEVLLAAFVLQRQYLGHLRPARLYVGRQAWAQPGASVAPQAEMLAVLFPGIKVMGDHEGALREPRVLVVDGALRNAATGTLIGAMMPQVIQWTAEARARVHAACGLPAAAEPPRVPGRKPRVLYLHAAPPRTLAEPVRERLFALFAAGGHEVAAADVTLLPWHRQVRLAYGADIVTGAHGPAMDVVLWAHPQARVLEFFPEGARRYDGQLLAEAAGLAYLGLEGVAERGFVTRARERWGPPVGRANRLVWALPWTMLEKALGAAK